MFRKDGEAVKRKRVAIEPMRLGEAWSVTFYMNHSRTKIIKTFHSAVEADEFHYQMLVLARAATPFVIVGNVKLCEGGVPLWVGV